MMESYMTQLSFIKKAHYVAKPATVALNEGWRQRIGRF